MSKILFMDSFDHYNIVSGMLLKWNTVPNDTTIGSGFGFNSQGIRVASTFVNKVVEESSGIVTGFTFRVSSATNQILCSMRHNSGLGAAIGINTSTGILSVSNALSQTLGTTPPGVISPNCFHHVEWKYRFTPSTEVDDCILYVDGVERLRLTTGLNTNVNGFSAVNSVALHNAGNTADFDHFYIAQVHDEDLSQFGYSFVKGYLPTASGSLAQFIGSDGDSVNNYALINDHNNDTYIQASASGFTDMSNFSDYGDASILGVAVNTIDIQTSGTVRQFSHSILQEDEVYDGSVTGLSGTLVNHQTIFQNNPLSEVEWAYDEVYNSQFGVRVQ